MLYFGLAVFVAVLLTPARRHLLTPWPWLGGAIVYSSASVRLLGGLPRLAHARVLGGLRREGGRGRPSGVLDRADRDDAAADVAAVAGGARTTTLSPGMAARTAHWVGSTSSSSSVRGPERPFLLPRPRLPDALRGRRRSVRALPWHAVTGTGSSQPTSPVLVVSGIVVAPITVLPVLPVETLARITGAAGGDAGGTGRDPRGRPASPELR